MKKGIFFHFSDDEIKILFTSLIACLGADMLNDFLTPDERNLILSLKLACREGVALSGNKKDKI